jgi:hypothetical protein
MKNIHLLPTEKPSRLFKFANELHLDTIPKDYYKKYNIYITSDEEIKEGDWVVKINSLYKGGGNVQKYSFIDSQFEDITFKKIILTTDQDLISDGVQAIDDEFLEWFVKNPSCEFVEVDESKYFDGSHGEYIIIIPQEEPNPFEYTNTNDFTSMIYNPQEKPNFTEVTINAFAKSMDLTLETEPETLEEAMSKDGYYESDYDKIWREGVHFGAKWQAENMPIHIIDVENIYVHIENGVIIVEKNKKK